MNVLKLLFHPLYIFDRIGVLELFLFALYSAVKFHEIVVAAYGFQP